MGSFELFVIRLVLSVMFAYFLCRIFFPGTPNIRVAGLAIIMFGLAYLFEYLRKRDEGGDQGR
jgi:hypothetical protein